MARGSALGESVMVARAHLLIPDDAGDSFAQVVGHVPGLGGAPLSIVRGLASRSVRWFIRDEWRWSTRLSRATRRRSSSGGVPLGEVLKLECAVSLVTGS